MVLSITNNCNMGCTHCMGDYKPCEDFMSMEVLKDVIDFIKRMDIHFILVSGGEPTSHPKFIEIMKYIKKHLDTDTHCIMIASNGAFLDDEKLVKEIIDLDLEVQITNDSRYYPKPIKHIEHKNFRYVDYVASLYPQGRASNQKPILSRVTKCFNPKLVSYQTDEESFSKIISVFERRFKFCFPFIDFKGDVRIGESRLCEPIGTIYDSDKLLYKAIQYHKCNKCAMNKYVSKEYTNMLTTLIESKIYN